MDKDPLNDPGLRAVRTKSNEYILPVACSACWHNPLLNTGTGVNVSIDVAWNQPPTTMIGTRPSVAITFSRKNREREEAEYVAGLGFWSKLSYRLIGFLRRQAD